MRYEWPSRRKAAESFLFWSGLGFAYERLARPTGAVILMYHSVARPGVAPFIDPPNHLTSDTFERQMLFLKRHRKVVSLIDLIAGLEAGETPEAGTVCITFDDGYLDNLTVAAPILASLYLPATVFLATGYIETAEPQWSDRVHTAIARRKTHRLTLPDIGIDADMSQADQRREATRLLHGYLLKALPTGREATLHEVKRQLAPPLDSVPRLGMSWDDVRAMRDRYPLIDIGGHSRRHTDLMTHGGETAREEIDGCAEDLRRELGCTPRLFAFPYSRSSKETRTAVSGLGWRAAIGKNDRCRVGVASDRFDLPRVETPRSMTDLRLKTSGAYPGAMILLGKR
jgi:peptidoglycan/xylan/chitin deacetylase (PgdA/CDA1 family)